MFIREFRPSDANDLLHLYRDTIRRINSRDYSMDQVDAWASDEIDTAQWLSRFSGRYAYVADGPTGPAGFIDMTRGGYIDRLFVSAEYQGQGLGNLLLEGVTNDAVTNHIGRQSADCSITAKPFFLAKGFTIVREQLVECRGQYLVNFRMERTLCHAKIEPLE